MEKIKIQYLNDQVERRLRYIDGKSDWIDLRAAEEVTLKKRGICPDSSGGGHEAAGGL